MLSIAFKGVRGLPPPSPGDEKGAWFIQVQHGAQRRCTRPIERGRLSRKSSFQRDFFGLANGEARWEDEVEIIDKDGQETVEISLMFEGEPPGAPRFGWSNNRRRRRHANTTVEMRTFRSQPEESVTVWLPLRSISPDCDDDSGAIQAKFTYSDDCMEQGYLFALFCGLVPQPLTDLWTGDTLVERDDLAYEKDVIPDHQPSTSPPSPTNAEPVVAPVGKNIPQFVSRTALSPQEGSRRVSFGPVSELVFQDYVEAGPA